MSIRMPEGTLAFETSRGAVPLPLQMAVNSGVDPGCFSAVRQLSRLDVGPPTQSTKRGEHRNRTEPRERRSNLASWLAYQWPLLSEGRKTGIRTHETRYFGDSAADPQLLPMMVRTGRFELPGGLSPHDILNVASMPVRVRAHDGRLGGT